MPFHLLSEPETRKSPWRAFNGFFTVAVTKRALVSVAHQSPVLFLPNADTDKVIQKKLF